LITQLLLKGLTIGLSIAAPGSSAAWALPARMPPMRWSVDLR
jgi:hypothetical protein